MRCTFSSVKQLINCCSSWKWLWPQTMFAGVCALEKHCVRTFAIILNLTIQRRTDNDWSGLMPDEACSTAYSCNSSCCSIKPASMTDAVAGVFVVKRRLHTSSVCRHSNIIHSHQHSVVAECLAAFDIRWLTEEQLADGVAAASYRMPPHYTDCVSSSFSF